MLGMFFEITGYAIADAVNPCAIAVLTMVLVSVLIAHPEKKREVFITGLMFTLSVYLGYLVYAGILYQLFNNITEFLAKNSENFKLIFGVLGMIIGGLNIKDYFIYRPGGIATEMPLFMRSKVRKITNKITSPKGAFFLGFFVTLFLLPCTAGPLILATGRLSGLNLIQVIPWLLYYNLIFVFPMIAITIMVYAGFTRVEDVSGWKERNIRKLHLIAGVLLFIIGFALISGWFDLIPPLI